MVIDNRDNPFEYILSGIRITEQYAQELGKKMRCYDLKIDSELDSPSGKNTVSDHLRQSPLQPSKLFVNTTV